MELLQIVQSSTEQLGAGRIQSIGHQITGVQIRQLKTPSIDLRRLPDGNYLFHRVSTKIILMFRENRSRARCSIGLRLFASNFESRLRAMMSREQRTRLFSHVQLLFGFRRAGRQSRRAQRTILRVIVRKLTFCSDKRRLSNEEKRTACHSRNGVRTDGEDEGENESSNGVFALKGRCLLSTSFNEELKNFAKVEIVEM